MRDLKEEYLESTLEEENGKEFGMFIDEDDEDCIERKVFKITVWEVKNVWQTEDENGADTYLFSTYDKAVEKFNNIVSDEIENCWSDVLTDDNTLKTEYADDYVFEVRQDYFEIHLINRGNRPSTLVTVEEKEVG